MELPAMAARASILAEKKAAALDPGELAKALQEAEALGDRLGLLSSYLGCLSADDANDEAVKADEAWLATLEAEAVKLHACLRSALARLDDAAFQSLLQDPLLTDAGYALAQMRTEGVAR